MAGDADSHEPDPNRHPFIERPHRTLVVFSVPVMLSLIAEPLTGLVDTAFVAQLGPAPLAALGVGTVLLSSLLWVFNFLGVGTQTEVAHALGARTPDDAREATGTALALASGLGVALGLLLWPVLGPLAAFMGAEGEVHEGTLVYLEIRLLGAPPLLAMMAAFARPGPMSAARSTPVAPSGRVRVEPSGRVMVRSAMVIPRLATPLRPRFDG